ncbi:hypothetical protein C0J52_27349 [Blattella germanica]|nr:hypothetical protein C0J52_27349 [Blattella germanica]
MTNRTASPNKMFGAKNKLLACYEDPCLTGFEIYAEQLSQIEFLGTKTHNKHSIGTCDESHFDMNYASACDDRTRY